MAGKAIFEFQCFHCGGYFEADISEHILGDISEVKLECPLCRNFFDLISTPETDRRNKKQRKRWSLF